TVLGDPDKATQRLNFAQSFNGLAAFLAPIVGGYVILAEEPKSQDELATMTEQARLAYVQAETSLVKGPYIVLGVAILVLVLLFVFTKLPDIKDENAEEGKSGGLLKALRHKNVVWGVIAQFFQVGAQDYVLSFQLVFVEEVLQMAGQQAKYYAGAAGLAFMVGRFVRTFFMRYVEPYNLLAIYSVVAALLCLVVVYGEGMVTLYALVAISFFMSIMFPTIFAMGLEGTGADTKSASSLIVMSIVGGAAIPPLASWITDMTDNMQLSYFVPLLSFVIVLLFAWSNKGIKIKE